MATPAPPRLPPGERLRRAGIAAWSIIGIVIVAALSVWALLKIRIIFPPLVLALFIIYLLNPLVTRLQRYGVSRAVGAIATYIVVLGGLSLLIASLVPFASRQISEFRQEWPDFRDRIVTSVGDAAETVEKRFGASIDTTQVSCLLGGEAAGGDAPTQAECDRVTKEFRDQIVAQAGRITEIGLSVLEILLVFILAPLIALYLLIDLPKLGRDVLHLVPETHRDEAADVMTRVGAAVGGFFRGQLFVALVVGFLSALGFWIIGLPFWLLIGVVAGFFNIVPLIGPYIGGTLGFFVGAISGGIGLGLKAALVEVIVQQLDNHVISPNVMKRTVNLHPATVMLSLLAGGALAGFWGVLLGVPAVAVGKIVLGHFWATRVLGADVSPARERAAGQRPPSVVPEKRAEEPPGEVAAPEPGADAETRTSPVGGRER